MLCVKDVREEGMWQPVLGEETLSRGSESMFDTKSPTTQTLQTKNLKLI